MTSFMVRYVYVERRPPAAAWLLSCVDMREGFCFDMVGFDEVETGKEFVKGWE